MYTFLFQKEPALPFDPSPPPPSIPSAAEVRASGKLELLLQCAASAVQVFQMRQEPLQVISS
jgi:hypothetical protein